ncbi:tRNA lysidine(34) synthetase TilS [Parenemella sanctibonifatiensis]|uniref:tRNA(Ile)-lysidine synthase n=1 Tax=Parenemella sanctibonifatiensis TaxID=2016505 RepID=A0A255DZG6_9ACTN|nr:tRNA lysidine(34) synthetase TilS [Parenemella sanctibonifatiensis]OYN84636.1 tRNA lysidine(34) synthetase TilS [Parenemella sanctibonifatiensis]
MAKRELGPAAEQVARAVDTFTGHGDWGVACSGGPDSMALAAGLAWVARRRQVRCPVWLVDHQLQPGSGDVVRRAAAALTEKFRAQLDPRVLTVTVISDGSGPEAAARGVRLAALAAAARHLGVGVLLGHTLDDQAESVLLGLARGSGARSLAGIPQQRDHDGVRLGRPLLGLRRAVTRQAAEEWGLPVWDDPHNADPRYARVRVRDRVLPTLAAELGPGIPEALARTADQLRVDSDWLDQQTPTLPAEPRCAELADLPAPLLHRALRDWLREAGGEVTSGHLLAVVGLVHDWHGQGPLQLPGLQVSRRAGRLVRHQPTDHQPTDHAPTDHAPIDHAPTDHQGRSTRG